VAIICGEVSATKIARAIMTFCLHGWVRSVIKIAEVATKTMAHMVVKVKGDIGMAAGITLKTPRLHLPRV
jgi:hypothetical protein